MSLTCQVQGEGNEAVIASQELQRLLPLHQSAKVICHRFPVEEVVDADQEIPATREVVTRQLLRVYVDVRPAH